MRRHTVLSAYPFFTLTPPYPKHHDTHVHSSMYRYHTSTLHFHTHSHVSILIPSPPPYPSYPSTHALTLSALEKRKKALFRYDDVKVHGWGNGINLNYHCATHLVLFSIRFLPRFCAQWTEDKKMLSEWKD